MTTRRLRLTIFQKMLVAPLLGVLCYSGYVLFVYNEHKTSSREIEQIRTVYLPALEYARGNTILFDTIAGTFKDAVLADEEKWVLNTRKDKAKIEHNLARLGQYAPIVNPGDVARLRQEFEQYYANAYGLAMAMLHKDPDTRRVSRLIGNVEQYYGPTSVDFKKLRKDLQISFSERINETNRRSRRQVVIAAGLGVVLVMLIIGVTFVVSLSTRKSLREVNGALKNMAQDTPDFSRRLARKGDDELGELVDWFNLLSDKLEKDYKQIELLSITDKLTQLYNRTKIDELFRIELNKARRYRQPLAVILLDLDHFKEVNDTYGHYVGDCVLKELAKLLSYCVRDTDHVGRWGGEEFIILSPNTNLDQARHVAEKLREEITELVFTGAGHRTGSFGVAAFREDDNEDSITRRADECLYLAKKNGRNRVEDERALDEDRLPSQER